MQTNTATGEERLQKMCWFQAAPEFMVEVIKASNRPAEAIESTRNEIVKGFGKVSWILQEGQQDELEDNSDD